MIRKTKLLSIAIALLALPLCCGAQVLDQHEVRLGWGDMLFETMAFHPSSTHSYPSGKPTGYAYQENRDYAYTGHIFAEYRYHLLKWLSFGMQADFQGIFWTTEKNFRSKNYDLTLLPNVRFTYLRREWVRMYAGLGSGLLIAWDNERNTEAAHALSVNLLGVQVGKGPWSGSFEINPMISQQGDNIYLLGSRIFSVSVNYTW
ncbi:MAG: hypothetical protein J6S99_06645 [Bacteroidales bacterium]|nr:hypothetical protein [Bacteroidales bacterium]